MSRERGPAKLLATFGTPPALTTAPPPRAPRERVNRPVAPRRGIARAGHGWCAVPAPLAVYQASTAQVGGWFPLLSGGALPAIGARMGYDATSGGAVYVHPVQWVLRSITANQNMIFFGEPGRGKSSTVVAFVLRMAEFGVRTLIAGDVKGEYTRVTKALGFEPITLGHGFSARLNALDLGPIADRWDTWPASRQREEVAGVIARWVRLLVALVEAQRHTPSVTDEMVLSHVLRRLVGAQDGATRLTPITIRDVQRELAEPDTRLWEATRFADRRAFLDQTRPVTDALTNVISGPLAGLFDAPSNVRLDWAAPIQSLDLSRLRSRGDQAIAVALTCLGSWSAMATDLNESGEIRCVVRDEVWRAMRLGLRATQSIDADLRLSRADQTIQILVGHKPSDLLTVGAQDSQAVAIAKDLLALCSIRVLLGQSTRVADDLAAQLSLSPAEQDAITEWAMAPHRRGRAVWKLESRPGIRVQTVLSSIERQLFDTNAQLRGSAT